MNIILGILAFILLTILTQIGGVALLIAWLFLRRLNKERSGGWRLLAAFAAVYAVMTLVIVPPLASALGRVPLECVFSAERRYAPANPIYCALNRNYVEPRLKAMLSGLARHMDETHPGTRTLYLDANFPFFDGFPLVPHLSHNDGRKLDLAFYYMDEASQYLPGAVRSPIGYFAFEQPLQGEKVSCTGGGWFTLRWDMNWLQPLFPDFKLDRERTRAALNWLVTSGKAFGLEKVLLEPHLASRLGVSSPLLRFQGCHAARHDDHMHVQIAP